METVWDYGGVIFKSGQNEVWQNLQGVDFIGSDTSHSVANARISYEPEYLRVLNVGRKLVEKFLGYRVNIEIDFLNILSGDGDSIATFLSYLTFDGSDDLGVQINVNPAGNGGVWFGNILLQSDVSMNAIHRLEIGQTLKLKFVCKELRPTISTITGNSAEYYIVDELGDSLLDESGNKIIGFE